MPDVVLAPNVTTIQYFSSSLLGSLPWNNWYYANEVPEASIMNSMGSTVTPSFGTGTSPSAIEEMVACSAQILKSYLELVFISFFVSFERSIIIF